MEHINERLSQLEAEVVRLEETAALGIYGDCGDALVQSRMLRATGCLHCAHVANLKLEAEVARLQEQEMKDTTTRGVDTQYAAPLATAGSNKQVPTNRPWWFYDERVYSREHAEQVRATLTPSQLARWDAGDASVLDDVLPWEPRPADPAVVATSGIAELSHVHAREKCPKCTELEGEVARLTQREADQHDLIAKLWAVTDPEVEAELAPLVNRTLGADDPDGHCGNRICALLNETEQKLEAAEAHVARLTQEQEKK